MILLVLIGFILMMVAAKLMEDQGAVGDIAMLIFLAGLAISIYGFFQLSPIKASASATYPVAGITKELSEMTAEAMLTAEPAEQIETEAEPEVSEADIELLARLITAEVGYAEAYSAKDYEELCYLTGAVVLNRVNDPDFSNNLYGVIYEAGQYACTWDGNMERPYDDIAWEIAEGLLTYGVENVPENVVYQAGFTQGSGVYLEKGNMIFCYK